MIYKFIIPGSYYLFTNLYISNIIIHLKQHKPIDKEVNDIAETLKNIIWFNKDTWINFNKVDLTKDYLEYLCLEYAKRYQDTRLVNWNGTAPKPNNYDFLIYLIFMLGNPGSTRLVNIELDLNQDIKLKLEVERKELNKYG